MVEYEKILLVNETKACGTWIRFHQLPLTFTIFYKLEMLTKDR